MKMIDPTYLRFVCDELKSGELDKSNLNTLPLGVSSFFDKIFDYEDSVIERKYILDKFTSMALLREGNSIDQISSLTFQPIHEWYKFIQYYSQYFNVDSQGNYRLFHDRFIIYLFQRSNNSIIKRNVRIILENIDSIKVEKWVVENKGYFLFLDEELEKLFAHISLHRDQQFKSWWIKDLERLLDGLHINSESYNIDFTVLCELLRGCFDFMVQRKGARIVVSNSSKIEWDELDSFFETTRFQYELAIEFSKNLQKLPKNWERIFLNEDHPCAYTFSYVWKYAQFNVSSVLDQALINRIWLEGSPYQRIIVIMIWGYRKINGHHDIWLDDLIALKNDWYYLIDERDMWVSCLKDKDSLKYQMEFINLNSNLEVRYHYILDSYWSLYDELEKLNQDVNYLWKHAFALDIAFWIYRHPVWEIGKIANEIVVNRLKVKDMRSETIGWLLDNWEAEEFFALGEVIFELKAYLNLEDFLTLVRKVVNTGSCQLRGSFISDLLLYLEGAQDEEFQRIICNDFLPQMISKANDIWEVQELIRLLNFFMDSGALIESQAIDYVNKMEIAREIDRVLHINYNEFWKRAEINKGIIR